MQPGGWFNTEINSADDLQGLRFRMPGQGGQVLGRLGASVQNIPGGEIYQALASGQIDGAEWIGPYADERSGLPGGHEPLLHRRLPRAGLGPAPVVQTSKVWEIADRAAAADR